MIKNLKENGVVYTKPNKSNGIVIIEEEEYIKKVENHIKMGPYQEIKVDKRWKDGSPLNIMKNAVLTTLNKLEKEGNCERNLVKNIIVQNPKLPQMYGLIKTHKEGNNIRPITAAVDAPTYKIAKYLVERFTELECPTGRTVKNSSDFAEKIRHIELAREERLVSFDIEALYPSVPVTEALVELYKWIDSVNIQQKEKKVLKSLTELCMKQSQFEFNNKIYRATRGTNMGNPLSPVIANFWLSIVETSIEEKNWFPRIWYRYMDDIFAVVKEDDIEEILTELNNTHRNN